MVYCFPPENAGGESGTCATPEEEPEEPPEPGFNPHNANPGDDCNRGARRLRVRFGGVPAPERDPLCPEEEEEEDDEGEGQEEVLDDGGDRLGRGSWRMWASCNPRISCSDHAAAIISELASAHFLSKVHSPLSWLRDIADYVQTPHVEGESLTSVTVRCRGAASKDVRVSFLLMVNCMALVCKCQSIRLRTSDTLKGIYRNEVQKCSTTANIAYRTFMDWHAIGSKFIAIASGGSIYALVLIAGLGL
ncbi:hypothetical protein BDR07DRAFT_1377577 [Suillus spraguei]|nr:hypothetical protein BDR07DRAFT_1377577 [Suillus spraguei]